LSVEELEEALGGENILVVDCRFDLDNTEAGRAQWLKGHVPGARYAHLDNDLSSPIEPHTGRHPLPTAEHFARFLSRIGWQEGRLLVAYDDGPGAIASRLWWLMRFYGKPAALLNGGFEAWRKSGLDLESGEVEAAAAPLPSLTPDRGMMVDTRDLESSLQDVVLMDARTSERFRGDVEPLDARAGHIPGAVSYPFGRNLELNGRFRPADELREDFEDFLDGARVDRVVHSCGSGVSACHNIFAMELAGLSGSRLYPGSWSEWIRDPQRPIATGAK
jgi:thiosulfate/3-mercaptopyruvate sulfurtransferase